MSSHHKDDDIIYTKVIFNPESVNDEDRLVDPEAELHLDEGIRIIHVASEEMIAASDRVQDNIWSVNDYALRDLLVHLVQKYRIDEVYDSKVKAQNWEKLIQEFHLLTENRVTVSKPQIIRKWHNWKQYNKARKKPHPFVVSESVTAETVMEKCSQLCERAKMDLEFAAMLARGPIETFENPTSKKCSRSGSESDEGPSSKKSNQLGLGKLLRRDFLVRRTGASAAALSLKRLQHEITLENLNHEYETWRIQHENNQLIQQKILKQTELIDIKIEKAETEFLYKKGLCLGMGIAVTDYKQESE